MVVPVFRIIPMARTLPDVDHPEEFCSSACVVFFGLRPGGPRDCQGLVAQREARDLHVRCAQPELHPRDLLSFQLPFRIDESCRVRVLLRLRRLGYAPFQVRSVVVADRDPEVCRQSFAIDHVLHIVLPQHLRPVLLLQDHVRHLEFDVRRALRVAQQRDASPAQVDLSFLPLLFRSYLDDHLCATARILAVWPVFLSIAIRTHFLSISVSMMATCCF